MTEFESIIHSIQKSIKRLNTKCAQLSSDIGTLERTIERFDTVQDLLSQAQDILNPSLMKEIRQDQSLLHKRMNYIVERLDELKNLVGKLLLTTIPEKFDNETEEDISSLRFSLLELD